MGGGGGSTIALPGLHPGELIADKGGKDNHEFDIIINRFSYTKTENWKTGPRPFKCWRFFLSSLLKY